MENVIVGGLRPCQATLLVIWESHSWYVKQRKTHSPLLTPQKSSFLNSGTNTQEEKIFKCDISKMKHKKVHIEAEGIISTK